MDIEDPIKTTTASIISKDNFIPRSSLHAYKYSHHCKHGDEDEQQYLFHFDEREEPEEVGVHHATIESPTAAPTVAAQVLT